MASKKRNAFAIILILICLTMIVTPMNVFAKNKFIRKQTYEIKSGKTVTYEITNPQKGFIFFGIYGTAQKKITKGGINVRLYNSKGKKCQNDTVSLKGLKKDDPITLKFYNSDTKRLPKGKYKFKVKNTTNTTLVVALVTYSHSKYSTKSSLKKTVTIKKGSYNNYIGKLNGAFIGIYWDYNNNDKVHVFIEDDGSIYADGYKKGKSTYNLRLKNGKKYKCKITVK